MRILKAIPLLAMCTGLAACGQGDMATRNAPFEAVPNDVIVPVAVPADHLSLRPDAVDAMAFPPETALPGTPGYARADAFAIGDIKVTVPRDLKVNEANLYYPWGDIVWRGDPYGNRKAQVGALFQEALGRTKPAVAGGRKADIEVVVRRFHSISEKTRVSIGGVHSITIDVVLRDPETGAVLHEVQELKANLDALGGERAKLAERQGLGMKERILRHLRHVFVAELTHPGGYRNVGPQFASATSQI